MGKQDFFERSDDSRKVSNGSSLLAPVIFLSIVSVLLALGGAYLLREYFESRESVKVASAERDYFAHRSDSLLAELQKLDEAFKNLTVENESLTDQISRHRREINNMRNQIAQLAGPEFESSIEGVQARITHLESELVRLQTEFSATREAHLLLSGEHTRAQAELRAASLRVRELESKEQELERQVDLGSRLSIVNIEVLPSYFRRSGERLTDRARRVTHLRVCFKILQNLIATPGEKTFYLRVVDANGNLAMIQPVGNFTGPDGLAMRYLASTTVNYQNAELAACIGFTIADPLEPGVYTATIFSEGIELRSQMFELR